MKSNITIEQVKIMIQAFLEEVCCALKIDSKSITITYSKNQTSYILVCTGDDAFDINEKILNVSIRNNSFTPIRALIYSCVRFIKKRRENFSWNKMSSLKCLEKDALDFSLALMILKGIKCPCPPQIIPENFFSSSLKILKNEF